MIYDSLQVSVIIVNYNTLQMTKECIDSVYEKTEGVSFEIILIDNRSTDGSKEFFEKDPRIKYVYSYENMGFGRANNVGIMLAKGEYIFLLNSDTILLNNAIKLFYDYAMTHRDSDKFFMGSWLLNRNQEIDLSFGEEPTMKTQIHRILVPYLVFLRMIPRAKKIHEEHPLYGKTCEVGYVCGADMFFHRSIYERYGAFDHNFFMYMEEAEWQKRVKRDGIKSLIIEGPMIVHLQGGSDTKKSSKHTSMNTLLMMRNSRRYFLRKYYNLLSLISYNFIALILETLPILMSRHYNVKEKVKYIFG